MRAYLTSGQAAQLVPRDLGNSEQAIKTFALVPFHDAIVGLCMHSSAQYPASGPVCASGPKGS